MRWLLLSFLTLGVVDRSAAGAASESVGFSREQIAFFEMEIRPVLAERCLDCHTGIRAKVGLQLNHREGWLRGSDYREIVDPSRPAESPVLHALRGTGKEGISRMPEKGDPLEQSQIEAIERWLAMGLPWPEEPEAPVAQDPRDHWSFRQADKPEPPAGSGHPIDRFIRAGLRDAGQSPAPRADRRTLYRRLHYNLLGLPPRFEDQESFASADGDHGKVWSGLIDRLLESPHYGERWARHWMDVARYADTRGYEAGGRERRFIFSHTYRDWLIRAFNEDVPFDRFILYQLAAEQLVDWEGPDRHHLAAMGFITLSKNGNTDLVLDDRIDTTFRGLMGLTVSCAKCHDHKSDPISTKEYYGLYGVFNNSTNQQQPAIAEPEMTPEYVAYLEALAAEEKKVSDFLEPRLAKLREKHPRLSPAQLEARLERPDRRKLQTLRSNVERFIANRGMAPDRALVVTDRSEPVGQQVFIRGNPARKGVEAPRRFLAIASPGGEPAPLIKGSGRLEMAQLIASPQNPLTARVIVNRVWMWHFGEGLVRTVSDFGVEGEPPSHPELLDWLATWFVENGWSVKELHRLILTSETWQQSADHPDAVRASVVDPENRLLWRSFRRRLDFEQMRDSFLAVSGNLERTLYGRSEAILEPPFSNRRTLYAFIDRQNLLPVFRHFDFSNPQETTGQRPRTTIPMQALFTMNSPFVLEQSALLSRQSAGAEDRVAHLHRTVFAREPGERDRTLARGFLDGFEPDKLTDGRQNLTDWSYGWGDVNLETNEVRFNPFPHWDEKKKEWRMAREYPLKDGPRRYLKVGRGVSHPGTGEAHAAVIRWHAPEAAEVTIDGELVRPAVNQGPDGLRIRVFSSRTGLLLEQVLPVDRKSRRVFLEGVQVEAGESLHFFTDSHGSSSNDSFLFDPEIVSSDGSGTRWSFSGDFSGPQKPMDAWEAYTHALLNSNRFHFID